MVLSDCIDQLESLLVEAEGLVADEAASEVLGVAQDALELSQAGGNARDKARACRLVLISLAARGEFKEACDLAKRELQAAREVDDQVAESIVLVGTVESRAVADPTNLSLQRKAKSAISLLKDESEHRFHGLALVALSSLSLEASRPEEAERSARNAEALFKEIGDVRGEASALHSLAEVFAFDGVPEEAADIAKTAAGILREAGLRRAEATELHTASKFYLQSGQTEDAAQVACDALSLLEDLYAKPEPSEMAYWKTLVQVHTLANRGDSALQAARESFERFQNVPDKSGEASSQLLISSAHFDHGHVLKAMRNANKAVFAFEDAGNMSGRGQALCVTARIRNKLRFFDRALDDLKEALNVFENIGDITGQGRALQQKAEVLLGKQDAKSALRYAVEAREIFQDAKDQHGQASALMQLCKAELAIGDFDRATRSAEEAASLFAECDNMLGEASAYLLLMAVYMNSAELPLAVKVGRRALALYREHGGRTEDEVYTLMQISVAQTVHVHKLDKTGQGTGRSLQDASEKAMRLAREALAMAKNANKDYLFGFAWYAVASNLCLVGPSAEAINAAMDSAKFFRDAKDLQWEAHALMLLANIYLVWTAQFKLAQNVSEEAVWLLQQVKDKEGENHAWEMLERVRKAYDTHQLNAIRQRNLAIPAAGNAQVPAIGGPEALAPEQDRSAAQSVATRGPALELGTVVTADDVSKIVLEVALELIGDDEDIEADMPLMEAGLTSNAAVLLRDHISRQIPSVKLPATLSFDYPSVAAITDLIMDQLNAG